MPLPPYIRKRRGLLGEAEHEAADFERYQTVYAKNEGSVAAPTAGLHFTPELLARFRHAFVTLHVGLGTFRPVKTEFLDDHEMHEEVYSIPAGFEEEYEAAQRIVAVGTTSARVLESAHASKSRARADADFHSSAVRVQTGRCAADEFSSAAFDAADAGERADRAGEVAGDLSRGGGAEIPVFQLRGCDVDFMKRVRKSAVKTKGSIHGEEVVGVALTWDGARWPRRSLSAEARKFLGEAEKETGDKAALGKLFGGDRVKEIRVCWVPRLRGGDEVLAGPHQAPDGLRLNFRVVRARRMGDLLGVVYRRKQEGARGGEEGRIVRGPSTGSG